MPSTNSFRSMTMNRTMTSAEVIELGRNVEHGGVCSYHSSHYENRVIHGQTANNGCLQYGWELEVEFHGTSCSRRDIYADGIKEKFGDKLAGIESDGSLDDGFEVISNPCTMPYLMKKFGLPDLLGVLDGMGGESHDTDNCGLHVHVGREQLGQTDEARDLAISKIMYIVDKFMADDMISGELNKFSRRKAGTRGYVNDYHYCPKNSAGQKATDKKSEFVKKAKESRATYHRYYALNLTNSATIEFRLFRGTLDPTSFAAALQLVEAICKFAMTHTLQDVQACTFKQIVDTSKYAEIREYCKRRGISID